MKNINSKIAIGAMAIVFSSALTAASIDVSVTQPQDSAGLTNLADGPTNSKLGAWTPCDNRNDNENLNADKLTLTLTISNELDPVTDQGKYDAYLIFNDSMGQKYIFLKERVLIGDSNNIFMEEQYISVPSIQFVDFEVGQANSFQKASGDLTICNNFEASCTTFDGDKGYLEDDICYPTSSISSDIACTDDDDEIIGYMVPATDNLEQGHSFLAANDPIWESSLVYKETFEEFFGDTALAFDDFALPQGNWQIVAILADREVFNIEDTTTWYKWDIENILVGNPWSTESCK